MKCMVLAGGSGDALWPLSRRNYPKQFVHMHSGRSPFQESIARNLPFCDEFYILTGQKYENIVTSQLSIFQGLRYRCILEEDGHQTAPIIALACMELEKDEDILVVSCDHVIGAGDYNGVILAGQRLIASYREKSQSRIVAVGCAYDKMQALDGHNFFDVYDDGQVDYIASGTVEPETCETGMGGETADHGVTRYADSGIFMISSADYLKAIRNNKPVLFDACVYAHGLVIGSDNKDRTVYTKEMLADVAGTSVGEAVYLPWSQSGRVRVIAADFEWERLLSLEQVAAMWQDDNGLAIIKDAENVHVLNQSDNKLIVVNGVSDITVTNDTDAVYITAAGKSSEIKDIIAENDSELLSMYFDEGDTFYTSWGCKETLTKDEGYRVKKITILPGRKISLHKHEKRSEHLSVVSGVATITLNGERRDYQRNENIFIPVGSVHLIENLQPRDLIMIEVGIGENVNVPGADMIRQEEGSIRLSGYSVEQDSDYKPEDKAYGVEESIYRLEPSFKDYIWGGSSLKEAFEWKTDLETVAEGWVLSAHRDGPSDVIMPGGGVRPFDKVLNDLGRDVLGWKSQPYDRFPLLVKFIDAKQPLSVQLHPADTFALEHENDYGKNEMWYVMDAGEGAYVYLGFEKKTSPSEVRKRIAEGTLTEILHKVPVKKGDSIMVSAGVVHAIGENIRILEVQQSSNATYRVYDYNRKDSQGNLRTLHIEKALANMDYSKAIAGNEPVGAWEDMSGYRKILLQQCKYFSVTKLDVDTCAEIVIDVSTFYSVVVLSGSGNVEVEDRDLQKANDNMPHINFEPGSSFFIPAGDRIIRIIGKSEIILSHV